MGELNDEENVSKAKKEGKDDPEKRNNKKKARTQFRSVSQTFSVGCYDPGSILTLNI